MRDTFGSRDTVVNNSVHRNIRIEKNQFVLRGVSAVKAKSASGLRVTGNTVRSAPESDDTRSVLTRDCGDVRMEKNIYLPLSD